MLKKGPKVVEFIVLLDHSFTILLPSNFFTQYKEQNEDVLYWLSAKMCS